LGKLVEQIDDLRTNKWTTCQNFDNILMTLTAATAALLSINHLGKITRTYSPS